MAEHPEIVLVLHPAVCHTERDHRLEPFGDHGLARVAPQARRGHIKQSKIVESFENRLCRIAESNIQTCRDTSSTDIGPCSEAEAAILIVLSNPADPHAISVKDNTVVEVYGQYLLEVADQSLRRWIDLAKEVEIASPTKWLVEPGH